jgi:peptidoglycan/LPS O-acetylase OafA/YrhL
VVLFHFNELLPFGNLGVDLFFVVSGLLVGGLLTKEFEQGKRINFFKFFLQRGFKIWPSFYFFMVVGTLVAYLFYHNTSPDQVIPFWVLKRYLFFYQNYTGVPFHWTFDHVWSLCVEEHFYIMLPVMFLIIQQFIPAKHQRKTLHLFVILTIIAGIIFKHLSFFFTNGQDTYSATHNRIDALAWGVLLNLLVTYRGEQIRSKKISIPAFWLGLALFLAALFVSWKFNNIYFNKIYFHSIVPIAFFLMLLGAYYVDLSKVKPLRFIAYYSYNWYLWHPIFVIFISRRVGNDMTGLSLYLIASFGAAMLSTIFIEETVLKKRSAVLKRVFKTRQPSPVPEVVQN